jgi:type IV pilus assembly protein PilC
MATAAATARKTPNLGAARAQLSRLKTFTWEGKDKRGIVMRGETLSKNENLVKADLRKQGINPSKVAERKDSIFGKSGSRITPREIAVFSRQLATMMASGVPMVQAFDIIAGGQKNPRMRTMLTEIKTSVEGGSSLSESITQFPSSSTSSTEPGEGRRDSGRARSRCSTPSHLQGKHRKPEGARSRGPVLSRRW